MGLRMLATSEVAERLGISRKTLVMYILRNPELRPVERLPNQDYLWSEAEIERIVNYRATSRRGRPKKIDNR